MAVPKDIATVKASGLETEKVKIEGVFPSNEEPQEFKRADGSTFKIERPYKIRIVDASGEIVSEDISTKSVSTPQWEKKFYEKDGYWNYTRGEVLLAVMQILRETKHKIAVELEEKGEFNVNDLEGVEFDAVLAGNDGKKWINWVLTFAHYHIWVPERAKNSEVKEEAPTKTAPDVDNTNMIQNMFGEKKSETPKEDARKTRDSWVKEAKETGLKLYYKDADGDRLVADEEQFKDKKIELFFKQGTNFISTESGLPF